MSGRKSVLDIFKSQFNIDYYKLLIDLNNKNLQCDDIAKMIETNYHVEISPLTVMSHLRLAKNKCSNEPIGKQGRKSTETLLKEKGIDDYESFLKSFKKQTIPEIKQYIEKQYGIEISIPVLLNHFKKYNIIIPQKVFNSTTNENIVFSNTEIEEISNGEDNYKSILIEKDLPLSRLFNATNDSGYIYLTHFPYGIFEVVSYMVIENKDSGHITIAIKAFKGKDSEETRVIKKIELGKSYDTDLNKVRILDKLTDYNFVKICKDSISKYIEEIKNLNFEEIKSLLCDNAYNRENMEIILEGSLVK